MDKLKVSDYIEVIGKEMYGDKFTIQGNKLFEVYSKAYQILLNGSKTNKSKGLLVLGDLGIGKSAMMKVLQNLFKDTQSRFKCVTGLLLKDMSEDLTTGQIKDIYGYGLKCDLYIDDIGFAIDVKRYGNTVNIISEIIMDRYDLFISSGFKTHVSSNIALISTEGSTPSIEKIYGNRVLDRLREMNELLAWNSKSLRK